MNEPYFIEVDENGCPHYGDNRTWVVVGPYGMRGGISYTDKADAVHLAEQLNDAYYAGLEQASTERNQLKTELENAKQTARIIEDGLLAKIRDLESERDKTQALLHEVKEALGHNATGPLTNMPGIIKRLRAELSASVLFL